MAYHFLDGDGLFFVFDHFLLVFDIARELFDILFEQFVFLLDLFSFIFVNSRFFNLKRFNKTAGVQIFNKFFTLFKP